MLMFDGFRLRKGPIDFSLLKQMPGLDFENPQNTETGIQTPYFVNGDLCKFIYNGTISNSSGYKLTLDQTVVKGEIILEVLKLRGSFHKNHFGGQNYLDFSHAMFQEEVAFIEKEMGIPATELRLTNLEIGVNIDVDFHVKRFLDNHLLAYMGHPFIEWKPQGKTGKSIGYSCTRTEFEIKVYDKGLQYDQPSNILRYEIKFLKMRELNKLGITYLADLLDQRLVLKCLKVLSSKWSKIKWSENIINPGIQIADRVQLKIYDSRKVWRNYWNADKLLYRSNNRKFKRLKKAHCANKSEELLQQIEDKFKALLYDD